VRRHAAPAAYPTVASLVGASIPRGGHEHHARRVGVRAAGLHPAHEARDRPGRAADDRHPTLQALALWAAMLIVVMSLLADLALAWLDPRIRASARPPG
jgi:hypothetical protein